MKQLKLLALLIGLAIAAGSNAQVPFSVTYDLSGGGNNVTSFAYNGTPVTGLSMGNLLKVGINTTNSMNNFRGDNWPLGATNGSDVFVGSIDLAKYIQFSMSPVSGYLLTIDDISFGVGRSGTGPRQWQWRGSHNAFAGPINNFTTLNVGLTNTLGTLQIADVNNGLTGNVLNVSALYPSQTGTSTFRLYGINAEAIAGTSGLQGNLTITGSLTFDLNAGTITGAPFALANCAAVGSGTLAYTSGITFTGNTFTVQLSDGLGSFDQPWTVGSTLSDLSSGTLSFNLPAGLPSGTGYRLRIVSSIPAGTGTNSAAFSVTQSGISCISSATDFFRSAGNGLWSNAATWESSSDGATFIPSTLVPGGSASGINIRSSDSIHFNSAIKSRNLSISGALAALAGSSLEQFGTTDFLFGSRYHHAQNGGQMPVASWNVNSTAFISGITNTIPTQIPQSYGNFVWDNTSQTQFYNLNNAAFSVSNLMEVRSTGTSNLSFTGASATSLVYNVNRYRQTGGTVNLTFLTAAGLGYTTLVVPGDFEVSAGTFSLGAGTNNPGAASYVGTLVLAGNLEVSSTASFRITGSGSNQFGRVMFNRSGSQTCRVSGSANREKVDYVVFAGSTTTILDGLGTTGANLFTVSASAILDAGSFQFTGNYTVSINGTLRTGNANGLLGASGTIGTGATLSTLPAGATVDYNRAGAQVVSSSVAYRNLTISGTGVKTADGTLSLSASTLLVTNTATLRLSGASFQPLNLNSGSVLQIDASAGFDNGGESQLTGTGSPAITISGQFITRDEQGFTGTNTAIPGIVPTLNPGCTIEYGRLGDQAVQNNADYQNLVFSGTGTKTATTTAAINGTVTIQDDVVLELANNTFGGVGTNLTMTGNSRLRLAGTGVKPDMQGSYALAPTSTIEFYNNALTLQSIRLAPTYGNIEVSGTNVGTATAGGSLVLQLGSAFTVQPGATFKLQNVNGFSGALNTAVSAFNSPTITLASGCTIEYNATAPQTITTAVPYQNLILSGTSSKSLDGSVSLTNLTLNGTVMLDAMANAISISGNWTSNTPANSFNAGLSKVEFNGTAAQQILAANGSVSFDTLTLNNSSSTRLSLNSTLAVVERRFNLIDGILFAPNATTARVDIGPNAFASDGSASSYVDGWISKKGTAAFEFPVGSDGYFAPIGISGASLATDEFLARYQRFGNPYDINSKDAVLEKVGSCEYWDLDRISGSSGTQVTLNYDDVRSCGVDVAADLRVARWDGTVWRDMGVLSFNAVDQTVTSGIVSSFSPFTLGSTSFFNPLPLEVLNFTGEATAPGTALVRWISNSPNELNLERSYNGKDWISIGTGESTDGGHFSLADHALKNWTYYRLIEPSENGRVMSRIISVKDVEESPIQLYPNPTQGRVLLSGRADQFVEEARLTDVLGAELLICKGLALTALNEKLNNLLANLSNGTYLLKIASSDQSQKLVFQVLK